MFLGIGIGTPHSWVFLLSLICEEMKIRRPLVYLYRRVEVCCVSGIPVFSLHSRKGIGIQYGYISEKSLPVAIEPELLQSPD
jgi:hypothetical protein